MKKLLILENDFKLSRDNHYFIFGFLDKWKGDVIDFSGLHLKTSTELLSAINDCTDIITQTCLVNGSDQQFYQILSLLSKIKEPKNVFIALLGQNLFEYLDSALDDEQIISIKQHSIYELSYGGESKKIDFPKRMLSISEQENYRKTGLSRKTGRKVKILACNATGAAFNGLKFGSITDEIDMSNQDPNKARGVWIWGNGEPIKLVNDCGLQEYEIASKLTSTDVLDEIHKSTDADIVQLTDLERYGLVSLIENTEADLTELSNCICEQLRIQKRSNRQKIYRLLADYRN